jgi:hypothetical protein
MGGNIENDFAKSVNNPGKRRKRTHFGYTMIGAKVVFAIRAKVV